VLDLNLSGSRSDGSSPLCCNTERIAGGFFGQSSLATHALVTERSAVKINADVPTAVLAPLGGDVQTGAGAVINTCGRIPALGSRSLALEPWGSVR
jgi:aryl-alcohol dehydrogenase